MSGSTRPATTDNAIRPDETFAEYFDRLGGDRDGDQPRPGESGG